MRNTIPLGIFAAILAALPGIALIFLALPHLQSGLASDAAIPVPNYMISQTSMPASAYRRAARALARTDRRDGDSQAEAAEAAIHAGDAKTRQVARLKQAVRDAPAEPRGWLLLSEALQQSDKRAAASALEQALVLAPYDYWLVARRAQDAAVQWDELDGDGRIMALRQVQLLWDEPLLREGLRPLLSTPAGIAIVKRAFAQRPGDLRDLNRWLILEDRRLMAEQQP